MFFFFRTLSGGSLFTQGFIMWECSGTSINDLYGMFLNSDYLLIHCTLQHLWVPTQQVWRRYGVLSSIAWAHLWSDMHSPKILLSINRNHPYFLYWLPWLQRCFSNSSWFLLLCNKLREKAMDTSVSDDKWGAQHDHSGYFDYRRTFQTVLDSYCCVTG